MTTLHTPATSTGRDDPAAPANADGDADDAVRVCLLERAEWRRCRRRYVGVTADDSDALAVIETWRKR